MLETSSPNCKSPPAPHGESSGSGCLFDIDIGIDIDIDSWDEARGIVPEHNKGLKGGCH